MNPFLMMLLQQIFQSGFDPNSLGTSMFGQNPSSNLNQGSMFGGGFNPFIFSPFPMGGNPIPGQGQAPLPGRPMDNRRRVEGGGLQPVNEPPVDIPAPPVPVAPRNPFDRTPTFTPAPNQPLFDDPGVPQGGVIAPPRDTTPFAAPPPSPFFIEPLPGIRVPINLTGIFGQGMPTPNAQGGGLPARPNNPNALGMVPRR